jgi:hypothetical protein
MTQGNKQRGAAIIPGRMKRLFFTVGLLYCMGALAQGHPASRGAPVSTAGLDVHVAAAGAEVRATGTWATKLKRGPSGTISPVNTVEILCSRETQRCIETRAQLVPVADARGRAGAEREHLALQNLTFMVTEWTEARITARADTPAGDLMLRVVPAEKLVRLSYWDTRPESRDKDGAASGFLWELQ